MNDLFQNVKQTLKHKTVRDEVARLKLIVLNSTNEQKVTDAKQTLELIKEYTVSVIAGVRDDKEFAFDDLMNIKDMRNFVHFYAQHITEYKNYKFSKTDAVHEIKYQIYNHIIKNYRIYDEPHEVSLLIMSMRGWIRQSANKSLQISYMSKKDEYLEQVYLEDSIDDSEMIVRDLAKRYLPIKENLVFELRFFEERGFEEIGQILNISKSAAHNRYERALDKIGKVIKQDGVDENVEQ